MPLSELYRLAKGKINSSDEKSASCSAADLPFLPENDFVELVWENGQVLMQGQSSRGRKFPTCNSLPSHCLPSHSLKTRDKDMENGTDTKTTKFGVMDAVLNEIPISEPTGEMGLCQEEMVPWLNYPLDQSLQQGYSDFLPELSGVSVHEPSTHNNFAPFARGNGNQSIKDSRAVSVRSGATIEQGNVSKSTAPADVEPTRCRSSTSQLYSLASQEYGIPSPYFKSRVLDNIGDGMRNGSPSHAVCEDSIEVTTSAGAFPGIKRQKQDAALLCNNTGLMNFSHFSRPAALVKASLRNIGAVGRMGSHDKGSAAITSHPSESTVIDSKSASQKDKISLCQPTMVPLKVDVNGLEAKHLDEPVASKPPDVHKNDNTLLVHKNDKNPSQLIGESATRELPDSEKTIEPAVASSSVCSGNSGERASDGPVHNLKRKHHDNEESECPSEDAEEESISVKKAASVRAGTGSKRSRAAEVHNLSERRRRDRINEKMRALQELIPNCNKVDKASMLDEAIEYLKTLQLQVQMMSMGAGLYMPHMMLPAGLQHMHTAHMAHFSPMGAGMGMGMGYGMGMPDMNSGSSVCPMVQVPPMHGAPFPGPTALHGMAGSNLQLFGLPGQGLPLSMPRAPLIPMSGGLLMKSTMGLNASGVVGPLDNVDSAMASCSKDPMQNSNSQVIQNTGTNSSMDQTPSQCQAINESFEQPATVQGTCQAAEVTDNVPFRLASGNEKVLDSL